MCLSGTGGWSKWPLKVPSDPQAFCAVEEFGSQLAQPFSPLQALCPLCALETLSDLKRNCSKVRDVIRVSMIYSHKRCWTSFLPSLRRWTEHLSGRAINPLQALEKTKSSNYWDVEWSHTMCCGIENGASRSSSSTFQALSCVGLIRGPPYYVQLEVNPDLMHWAAASNAVYLP